MRIVIPSSLWYESEVGEKFFGDPEQRPPGFEYQWSASSAVRRECYHVGPRRGQNAQHTVAELIVADTITWPADLVLAMTRPTKEERHRAAARHQTAINRVGPFYTLEQAILIAAHACERCVNVLCWTYGLVDGYAERSEAWCEAGTSCSFCVHMNQPELEVIHGD